MNQEIQKPIFIVGCPRSGTTILARILNNHSKIASATETHFFNHLSKLKKYNWHNVDDQFLNTFFNETRIEDFCSLLKVSFDEFKDLFEKSQKDSSLDLVEQNQKRIFDTLMLILLKRHQKTICCEKTPQHLLSIEKILRFYPDAKIIHLIRDGRDTVNSLLKMPWRPEGLLNNSRFWKSYAKLGLSHQEKFSNKKDNYFSVKYEDLLLKPDFTLKALCDFIEQDFEEDMLAKQNQKQTAKKNTDSGIFSSWESSWKHKAMEELDSTRVGAWQKELSQKDQTLINWHLRNELKALGYIDKAPELKAQDKLNICSEYGSLVARKLTRSLTDLIS